MSEDLKKLRDRIDALDEQILDLISARAQCAHDVGEIKRAEDENVEFYRPDREAQVLRRIAEMNSGPFSDEIAVRLFRELVSACLALEKPLNVAFLGPKGTFTEEAASKHFGHAVATLAQDSIDEVFHAVETSLVDYGVVPVENSSEGSVSRTLDNFINSPLQIIGEVELKIHHCLLTQEHCELESIKVVYGHQQALAQCRKWLQANLPQASQQVVASNAQGALRVVEEKYSAAIASAAAGEQYELHSQAQNIEDLTENTTRFLVLGRKGVEASGIDKTSLMVSAPNKPGSLAQMLATLADNGVSLSRIESRPSRGTNWEYVFFLDLQGHISDQQLSNALAALSGNADLVKVLGSYPQALR